MGTYVVVRPDGTQTRVEGGKKIELSKLYELIGCTTVECTPVKFEGKKRDCWLDEEGLYHQKPVLDADGNMVDYRVEFNSRVRAWRCPKCPLFPSTQPDTSRWTPWAVRGCTCRLWRLKRVRESPGPGESGSPGRARVKRERRVG